MQTSHLSPRSCEFVSCTGPFARYLLICDQQAHNGHTRYVHVTDMQNRAQNCVEILPMGNAFANVIWQPAALDIGGVALNVALRSALPLEKVRVVNNAVIPEQHKQV